MPSQAGEESDLSACVCVCVADCYSSLSKEGLHRLLLEGLSFSFFIILNTDGQIAAGTSILRLSKPWTCSWTGRANMFSRRAHLDKYQMVMVWIVLRICLLGWWIKRLFIRVSRKRRLNAKVLESVTEKHTDRLLILILNVLMGRSHVSHIVYGGPIRGQDKGFLWISWSFGFKYWTSCQISFSVHAFNSWHCLIC